MRIGGGLRGAVLAAMPDGTTVLRNAPRRKRPPTPAMRAAAARFEPVAQAWRAIPPEAIGLWRAYAAQRGTQPYRAFTALASKRLQMRPHAPVPLLPPAGAFAGDGIVIGVSSLSPRPPLQDEPLGEGEALVFAANAPNAPGVVTELLAVRVPSANRRPQLKAYRTRAFASFAAGALAARVPVEGGAWACAARFVREDTGQEVGIVEIGTVVA